MDSLKATNKNTFQSKWQCGSELQTQLFLAHNLTNVSPILNPFTTRGDYYVISPYNITLNCKLREMRIKEMISNKKALCIIRQILFVNTLRKCILNVYRIYIPNECNCDKG